MTKFTKQQVVQIPMCNLYEDDFQIWDPGILMQGGWLHRWPEHDSVWGFSYIQKLWVGAFCRIIWDSGGWWIDAVDFLLWL